jgi:hypothetical protein
VAKATVDAKGDLLVGTADNTVDRLAVGTDGFTLVADSSVSPQGLKWAVDPVADVVTTAGDLIYGTAADTVARLGIGTASQVLAVNSGATAPEWVTPAGGGGMTLINTGGTTLSGASITISSIPATYNNLQLVIRDFLPSLDSEPIRIRFNGDTGTSYTAYLAFAGATASAAANTFIAASTGNDNALTNSLVIMDIPDYANTVTYKIANYYGLTTNSSTPSTQIDTRFGSSVFFSTSAISSITIFPDGGNFTSGTAFLYGVK